MKKFLIALFMALSIVGFVPSIVSAQSNSPDPLPPNGQRATVYGTPGLPNTYSTTYLHVGNAGAACATGTYDGVASWSFQDYQNFWGVRAHAWVTSSIVTRYGNKDVGLYCHVYDPTLRRQCWYSVRLLASDRDLYYPATVQNYSAWWATPVRGGCATYV